MAPTRAQSEFNRHKEAGFSALELGRYSDAIVSFSSLDAKATERVVDKLIGELELQLAEKRVSIKLTDKSRKYLAKKGYDPDYGARPLKRLILKEIGDVLTEEILFGRLAKGGEALVDEHDKALTFSYTR